MMLDENAVKKLLQEAIDSARCDEVEISVSAGRHGDLRFACNTATNSSESDVATIHVNAAFGKRQATVTVSDLSAPGLIDAVRRAEELARIAPESSEHMPRLGPQEYESVDSWDAGASTLSPADRAEQVGGTLAAALDAGLDSSGFFENSAGFSAIANSAGLFAYQVETKVAYSVTMRSTAGGSGWSAAEAFQANQVDGSAITRAAMSKALMSQEPVELAPGAYPTILEPSAVSDMLMLMMYNLDRRAADEERSYFGFPGQRIGDAPFPESINVRSDPAHPLLPTRKWDQEGAALHPVKWIDSGRIANLVTSRYWAKERGVAMQPLPHAIIMDGGSGGLDELIADTDYALLLGCVWYIREVDPRTLLHTGLTRDGLFLVEHGKVTRPVVNFRWNDSPAAVLQNVDRLSSPVLAVGRESGAPAVVPALRTKAFRFTSVAPSS